MSAKGTFLILVGPEYEDGFGEADFTDEADASGGKYAVYPGMQPGARRKAL